jgi:hypothetical protein
MRVKNKITLRKAIWATSFALVAVCGGFFVMHLKNPEVALAASCESSYTLDWSNPATYSVTCGDVNSSNWSVKGLTCTYSSPLFEVGGNIGGPDKEVDISARINQSGNLDNNDTCWVYMYSHGSLIKTFTLIGGGAASVFTTNHTFRVYSGGTYQIKITLKNDKSNELWQIKNGDVTSCLRALNPLPVSLGNFKATVDAANEVQLKWTTFTEINNDYFTVERSASGSDYQELARINGAGNSTTVINYSYTDTDPETGINYYRLRQTDFDGTVRTSSPIKVQVSKITRSESSLQVYPNPFSTNYNVRFHSDTDQAVEVRLVRLDGSIIFSDPQQIAAGANTFKYLAPEHMKKGNYLVQVVNGDKVLASAKVVCQ